jgi:hypothetical protein
MNGAFQLFEGVFYFPAVTLPQARALSIFVGRFLYLERNKNKFFRGGNQLEKENCTHAVNTETDYKLRENPVHRIFCDVHDRHVFNTCICGDGRVG